MHRHAVGARPAHICPIEKREGGEMDEFPATTIDWLKLGGKLAAAAAKPAEGGVI